MTTPDPGEPARPIVVTLAAWLVIVPASIGAGLGVVRLATTSTDDLFAGDIPAAAALTARLISILFVLGLGVLLVWLGLNLLRLRRWARITALILHGIALLVWVPSLLDGSSSTLNLVASGILPVVVIGLLMSPAAAVAFMPPPEP